MGLMGAMEARSGSENVSECKSMKESRGRGQGDGGGRHLLGWFARIPHPSKVIHSAPAPLSTSGCPVV